MGLPASRNLPENVIKCKDWCNAVFFYIYMWGLGMDKFTCMAMEGVEGEPATPESSFPHQCGVELIPSSSTPHLNYTLISLSIIPEILILGGLFEFYLQMKIFSWMKSKLHGKDNTIKPEPESMSYHIMHQPSKEEFSGCPSTLLAIGTFGNNLKDSEKTNNEESLPSSEDHLENTTPEEFGEVKELRILLNKHIPLDSSFSGESENYDLSIEKFLDSLPEDEEIVNELISDASENKDALLQRTASAVHRRGKDIPSDNRKNGMYRKSLSFLLKKALLCGGGFVPSPILNPILKDPSPDPKLDNSRMEKILRAMLRKKKYPQRQRYLDMPGTNNDEEQGEASNGNNWVKTDSEYIVLEL
ncbi:hypothetical protein Pfo_003895 [Paulownia fortunei]|nr:hypothetical protein Pfo_003895 [Paulownia fortunei]